MPVTDHHETPEPLFKRGCGAECALCPDEFQDGHSNHDFTAMSTTTEPLLKVSTSDKKYTVVQHSNGSLEILRCGEHWMDKTGNNFILTLAQDLDGARESGSKLAAELLWIVQGIRDGHIKSKPTIDRSDENATEWPMVTLEEHIWKALNAVGIREAQPA